MLLSALGLDSRVRSRIRHRSPGGNLKRLLETVEEFLHVYRKVDDESRAAGLDEQSVAGFTERLQPIVDRLRQLERGR